MYYTCLHVSCDPGFLEILMAEIAETGFDTFMETPTGFEAYVELEHYNAEAVIGRPRLCLTKPPGWKNKTGMNSGKTATIP
jgi:hypothetical protein